MRELNRGTMRVADGFTAKTRFLHESSQGSSTHREQIHLRTSFTVQNMRLVMPTENSRALMAENSPTMVNGLGAVLGRERGRGRGKALLTDGMRLRFPENNHQSRIDTVEFVSGHMPTSGTICSRLDTFPARCLAGRFLDCEKPSNDSGATDPPLFQ